jgi:pilus assembly protein CpaD
MSSVAPKSRFVGVAAAAVAAAVSVALAACEERHPRLPDYMAVALNDADARHPIGFEDRREVLHIDVPPRARGLSDNQFADMHRFVARYKAEGVGRLTVSISRDADGQAGASRALAELARVLRDAAIAPSQVVRTRHSDTHRSRSMVRLSYVTPHAIAPECGHWYRDVARDRERVHYPEFGCATQRNLAGMVANARDLQRPQDEQPRSAERRTQTWSKYIAPDNAQTADSKAKAEDTTKK